MIGIMKQKFNRRSKRNASNDDNLISKIKNRIRRQTKQYLPENYETKRNKTERRRNRHPKYKNKSNKYGHNIVQSSD